MAYTVLGLFDSMSDVNEVKRELKALGIPDSDIRVTQQSSATAQGGAAYSEDKGFWKSLKEMFTGDDEGYRDADYYAEGTRRGGILVSVDVSDERAESAADILRRHNAVNIDERAEQWRASGWQYSGAAGAAGSTAASATTRSTAAAAAERKVAVPVTQEELAVEKRRVDRGGIRLVRRVTEKPVEANVNLREEHVNVQRRPVDRPLTGAEAADAFRDKVVEVKESAEEAVAAKQARVVEEVVVDKDVKDRTEKVRDTVRRTDVEVERLPGQGAAERTEKVSGSTTSAQTDRTKSNA